MDRLDDLLRSSRPLLDQVDDLLARAGAPAEHPIWAELRRVRLLPGEATRAVAALRPGALAEAGPELRAEAQVCVTVADDLPAPDEWTGDAADAYDEARRRIAAQLSGGDESLDERLQATADLAEALRDWMEQTRAAVAAALARVLTSSEAFVLTGGETAFSAASAVAAADIGAHLLRTVADHYELATDLIHGSRALTEATPM